MGLSASVVPVLGSLASVVADPPGLAPARQQMALSLGWHIVLACFGVAFPAMIWVLHRRGVRQGDEVALGLARRWSKVAAVLFAIGAVSGTILSFEMGILWPGLMGTYGDVIGLPFALEGLAFFTEAIFIGIYLYGWDRIPPKLHYRMLIPIMAAGAMGTFCILAVNAWMQAPTGFRLVDGEVVDIDPVAAMFNDAVWGQAAHMFVAAYLLVGTCVASVYAVGMLRGRRDRHHRTGFTVAFAFATVAALAQPFIGHLLGLQVGDRQPAKLAAFELSPHAESQAPLRIGGLWIDGEPRFSIDIPKLGSLIARNSFDGVVPGIHDFPEDELPPINITRVSFQVMVGIGTALAVWTAAYWVARWRKRDWLDRRWFLWTAAASGAASIVALEAGWIATEVGRQPWIAYGVLRTVDAASTSEGLWISYGVLVVVYAAMTVGAVIVLRSMARRWREGESLDLPTPYGPQAPLAHEAAGTGGAARAVVAAGTSGGGGVGGSSGPVNGTEAGHERGGRS